LKLIQEAPGVIHRAERKRDERSRSGGVCGGPAADGGDAHHRLWNRGVGIIQLTGGFSLFGGGGYGRFIGIFAATLGAIESLFAIGGPHPWWALGIFVVSLWVLHGLIVYNEDFAAQT